MSILNTPIAVNGTVLRNRLVMPPMATGKSTEDGRVTDSLCAYYRERAAGGCIGLIITEHSFVSPEGKAGHGQLSAARDDDIPALRQLVESIHAEDTKVMAQISHAGGAARREVTGMRALSPSGLRLPRDPADAPASDAMTEGDIEKVVQDFAAAASRVRAAGYDGVEIHAAHGYLLNQFFSPLTNRRTDRYSGETLEGRVRLLVEVVRAVRASVGEAYPVALRLGACDYMEGGSTIADAVYAAEALENAGVDLLDISGGFCSYRHPTDKTQGYFREITEAVKRRVSVPVILTGGVVDAAAAEALLAQGSADMIGVGRALLKDSGWARRAVAQMQ